MHKSYMKLSLLNKDIKKSIWLYVANFWFLFEIDKSIKFDDCKFKLSIYQGIVNFMCVNLAPTSSTGFVYVT